MPKTLRDLKRKGFSDRRLAYLFNTNEKRSAREAARARHPPGLQARRHLRRGVRDARPPTCIRPTRRSARPRRPTEKKIMVLGGGPNRIGQGIEFDYCCVHAALRAARGRLRDHHGQLQPGDGVDRLRHLRPAVLRAAHARGRARDRRHGKALGRDRAVRRPDAAQARARPRSGRRADHRHQRRLDRHRRGPRALPAAARRSSSCASRPTAPRARWRRR